MALYMIIMDNTWVMCIIQTCVWVYKIVTELLRLERTVDEFLRAGQFIVRVWKWFAQCIKYIIKKACTFKTWITRRNIQMEQEQIDENNTACRFIVRVWKCFAQCIKYIIKKACTFKTRITRTNIQLEQEQIDENNNVECHLEASTSLLPQETIPTPNEASQCSMRNSDVIIHIESLQ
ncbi:hypothetical protein R5R35_005342 [Gryllus longicercus]|uniref:Uncharacterized protein n=1 Tax=Gryllus longicercus TaxID=2509291 RepID=A0AAN9VEC3_9ORTH